jgi:hypothetical protein
MRALWLFHRRAMLALGGAGALVVAIVLVSAIGAHGSRSSHHTPSLSAPEVSSTTLAPSAAPAAYVPSTVDPAATQSQTSVDQQLARAESASAIAAVGALAVPAGGDSTTYPAVPAAARLDPTAYAMAFSAELLDRDYRGQSQSQLLAWAEDEAAANTLPGVPAPIAGKALYASLVDPGMAGGTAAGPMPTLAEWAADKRAGETQRMVGVTVTVDSAWSRIIGDGWEPRDPLMTIMDVKGTLIVTAGTDTTRHAVAMVVTLGSCLRTPGLGAVAVQDWTIS